MQVPVPKTSEPEVIGLPGTVFCGLNGIDERASVRLDGSVSVQGVKHVVDRANVLFAIMVHAKAATPFGFQGEQDDPFADFKFRVRFVMGMTRPQILEDLLDGLLDEGTSVCQRSFKHGQDLGLVDVRQILAGLDLPPEFLVAFDAQDAAQFHPVDQDLPDILFQLLQQFVFSGSCEL